MDTKAVFNPNRKLVTKMFMLEVKVTDPDSNGYVGEAVTIGETYKFASIARLCDFVYLVEGESLPLEYRMDYQRLAPTETDMDRIRKTNSFLLWEVGNLTYSVSWRNPMKCGRREKQCFPQPSKWYHRNEG